MPKTRTGIVDKRRRANRDAKLHTFATVTASQAQAWIDNNVTDLTSAKTALKHLATMIIYLRDYVRITEED